MPYEMRDEEAMEKTLKGKTILVTGGSGRLGDTLISTIVREGGNVIFTTRDALKAEAFNSSMIERGSPARAMTLAMREESEIRSFVTDLLDKHGRIDGFVHNAYAVLPFMPVGKVPWSHWMESMRVGVAACETIASALVENRAISAIQSIVNVSSVYAVRAPQFSIYEPDRNPNPVYYGPVKSAVLSLTRYLAAYWGELDIRVNAVTAGGIFAGQDPEFLTRYGATVPQRRMVTAQEVSNAIVFLLGDKSRGITGTSLVVDAGKTIW